MKGWSRPQMAARAAAELAPGDYVNLGIGIPTLVADFIAADSGIMLQTENGMLGVGPAPSGNDMDPDLVNAGKQPISELAGASYFSSSSSFAMIRGGHIDVAILGAMQVSETGDLANWAVPGEAIKGPGGAMDLVAGVRRVIVVMEHNSRSGAPKLKVRCDLPLTGRSVVQVLITDLGIFDICSDGIRLRESAPGISIDEIRARSEARIK